MTVNSQNAPETKAAAEALIPQFRLTEVLNQDQNGRRISLVGDINGEAAVLVLERAAFPSNFQVVQALLGQLINTRNLGANDVYRWYMANTTASTPSTGQPPLTVLPDIKVNLIWPASAQHIRKYTSQPIRYVTETSDVYRRHVRPFIQRTQRTTKRLEWIYNILDGRTEQEDVVYRSVGLGICTREDKSDSEGFLMLPDLNWDRRTVTGLHMLALVERRDLWSLRDLRTKDVQWLKTLRGEIVEAAAVTARGLLGRGTEKVGVKEFKCYVHYHPTYWHFHIHVVHVMLEAEGNTQSVGKAIALENIISWLESMPAEKGMDDVDLTFFVGTESDVWKEVYGPLDEGQVPT